MRKISFLALIPVFAIYIIIFRFLYFENGLDTIIRTCIPVFSGFLLAVLLNPLFAFIQNRLMVKSKFWAILITYVLFFGIITLLVAVATPSIIRSLKLLLKDLPNLFSSMNTLIMSLNEKLGMEGNVDFQRTVQDFLFSYAQKITLYLTAFINGLIGKIINFLNTLWNFIISVIISVYILSDKESLENWFYKLCHSLFERKYAKEIVNFTYSLIENVNSYFLGKLIDSFIVGVIAYLGSRFIIEAPYPVIDGVIIGITNIIPYFGAFMGGIPVTLIAWLNNPHKGFLMGIFIIILQQIDGLFLCPKIIGVKLSIKPIIIIVSIIIGGGMFGVMGMLLSVPLAALAKTSIDTFFNIKLKDKI